MKTITWLLVLIFCLTFWFCIYKICYGCEFGTTYKDYNPNGINGTDGKPDSYDLAVSDDGGAYYFPNGEMRKVGNSGTIWEQVFFDNTGTIAKYTGYTWCGMENPPPKGREPYIVYKGHRWYPQYHGIIYVYKDGRELK